GRVGGVDEPVAAVVLAVTDLGVAGEGRDVVVVAVVAPELAAAGADDARGHRHAVPVRVLVGAGVAGVADPVAVHVGLGQVGHEDAVVDAVGDAVAVSVLEAVGDAVGVDVVLDLAAAARAGRGLERVEGAAVVAVARPVTVAVHVGDAAAAAARLDLERILRTRVAGIGRPVAVAVGPDADRGALAGRGDTHSLTAAGHRVEIGALRRPAAQARATHVADGADVAVVARRQLGAV